MSLYYYEKYFLNLKNIYFLDFILIFLLTMKYFSLTNFLISNEQRLNYKIRYNILDSNRSLKCPFINIIKIQYKLWNQSQGQYPKHNYVQGKKTWQKLHRKGHLGVQMVHKIEATALSWCCKADKHKQTVLIFFFSLKILSFLVLNSHLSGLGSLQNLSITERWGPHPILISAAIIRC